MKQQTASLNRIKKIILPILQQNKVVQAGIFGSYARGQQKKNSDIDLLIKVRGRKFSLLDLVGLEMELQKALKKKVDVLTYNGISPYLRERILHEEVRII